MITKTRSTPPTGSDVLAKAAAKAEISADDLRAIRIWLADQLVAQEYAKLGQGGHTNTQVPLRQVFVDLPIASNASASMHSEDRTLFLSSMLSAGPLDLRSAFKARSDMGATSHAKKKEDEEDAELFDSAIEHDNLRSRWGATLRSRKINSWAACLPATSSCAHPSGGGGPYDGTAGTGHLVHSRCQGIKEQDGQARASKRPTAALASHIARFRCMGSEVDATQDAGPRPKPSAISGRAT